MQSEGREIRPKLFGNWVLSALGMPRAEYLLLTSLAKSGGFKIGFARIAKSGIE
jgi:hypothetical protein